MVERAQTPGIQTGLESVRGSFRPYFRTRRLIQLLGSPYHRGIGTKGLPDPVFQRKSRHSARSMKGRCRRAVVAQVSGKPSDALRGGPRCAKPQEGGR
jgi:hypothetical protein